MFQNPRCLIWPLLRGTPVWRSCISSVYPRRKCFQAAAPKWNLARTVWRPCFPLEPVSKKRRHETQQSGSRLAYLVGSRPCLRMDDARLCHPEPACQYRLLNMGHCAILYSVVALLVHRLARQQCCLSAPVSQTTNASRDILRIGEFPIEMHGGKKTRQHGGAALRSSSGREDSKAN